MAGFLATPYFTHITSDVACLPASSSPDVACLLAPSGPDHLDMVRVYTPNNISST